MSVSIFRQNPAVQSAIAAPNSARSVLNYLFGCDTSDKNIRAQLSTDVFVNPLMEIWFQSGNQLDDMAKAFVPLIRQLKTGMPNDPQWSSLEGVVAQIFLADQLSRSAFRGTPESFEYDDIALTLVRKLTADESLSNTLELPAAMIYLLTWALAHSETAADLLRAIDVTRRSIQKYPAFTLYQRNLKAIEQHHQVLEHFGRYPQRNAQKCRQNTPQEQQWLDDKDNLPIWAGGKGGVNSKLTLPAKGKRSN